jgi:hypothetical protein
VSDLKRARELLFVGGHSCVLCKGESIYTSNRPGLAPLLEWLDVGVNLSGYSAADKIVGKASAMLLLLVKVKEVYTPVIGRAGAELLSRHGVSVSADTLVEYITNQQKTGPCPMEMAVEKIDDPILAIKSIRNKLQDALRR